MLSRVFSEFDFTSFAQVSRSKELGSAQVLYVSRESVCFTVSGVSKLIEKAFAERGRLLKMVF